MHTAVASGRAAMQHCMSGPRGAAAMARFEAAQDRFAACVATAGAGWLRSARPALCCRFLRVSGYYGVAGEHAAAAASRLASLPSTALDHDDAAELIQGCGYWILHAHQPALPLHAVRCAAAAALPQHQAHLLVQLVESFAFAAETPPRALDEAAAASVAERGEALPWAALNALLDALEGSADWPQLLAAVLLRCRVPAAGASAAHATLAFVLTQQREDSEASRSAATALRLAIGDLSLHQCVKCLETAASAPCDDSMVHSAMAACALRAAQHINNCAALRALAQTGSASSQARDTLRASRRWATACGVLQQRSVEVKRTQAHPATRAALGLVQQATPVA